MAIKPIRALLLPNKTSVRLDLIAQVTPYENGVGLLNERNRMIGWIEIRAQDKEVRKTHSALVLETLHELVNNPRQAAQPDWSFLQEGAQ